MLKFSLKLLILVSDTVDKLVIIPPPKKPLATTAKYCCEKIQIHDTPETDKCLGRGANEYIEKQCISLYVPLCSLNMLGSGEHLYMGNSYTVMPDKKAPLKNSVSIHKHLNLAIILGIF